MTAIQDMMSLLATARQQQGSTNSTRTGSISDPFALPASFDPSSPNTQASSPQTGAGPTPSFGTSTLNFLFVSQTVTPAPSSTSGKPLFASLDSDGNGLISRTEFGQNLGAGQNTGIADGLFTVLDKNVDGSIDGTELTSPSPKPLFASLDTNGNGLISQPEFESSFASSANGAAVDGVFNVLDKNSDGSIDGTELAPPDQVQATYSQTPTSSAPADTNTQAPPAIWDPNSLYSLLPGMQSNLLQGDGSQILFNRLDSNSDALVSPAEFAASFAPGTSDVQQRFNALDANGNGSVDWHELAVAQANLSPSTPPASGAPSLLSSGGTAHTVANADGTSTASITYPDGSVVTLTTPASSSGTSADSGGGSPQSNPLERLIQLEAQFLQSPLQSQANASTDPSQAAPSDSTTTSATPADSTSTAASSTPAASDPPTPANGPSASSTDPAAVASTDPATDSSTSNATDPNSAGTTASTVTNTDGSTTTTIKYSDGFTATLSSPPSATTTAASDTATSSSSTPADPIATLLSLQAQSLSAGGSGSAAALQSAEASYLKALTLGT